MSELPEGWQSVALGEIIQLNPKNECQDEVDVGFVPMPLLGMNYRSAHSFEVKKWREVKKGYTHFQNGDVLLAKITPCFENGKAGIAQGLPNGMGAGSTEYFVCRTISEVVDSRYLLAYFKTESFLKAGELQMTGSVGHKRVPKDYVLETEIPLPPLAEQKRIADKLDALLARVDAARARLQRIPRILKQFRQSVLAAATSGRLTEEWREECRSGFNPTSGLRSESVVGLKPDLHEHSSWRTLPFADVIFELKNGLPQKPNEEGKGNRILRISSVRTGKVDFSDCRFLEVENKELATYSLRRGDLLFTRYNGSLDLVGVCGLIRQELDENYIYPDKLMRVRVNTALVTPEYVEVFMGAPNSRDIIEGFVKSSAGQKGISGGDLKGMLIDLPSLEEQKEITRRVESLFAWADRLETRYHTARARLDQLTPALLAKAFRGQLVPQNPDDEPAAVLLERVRAGRDSEAKSKKPGKRKPATTGE